MKWSPVAALELLLSVKIEVLIAMLSGVMSAMTAVVSYRNAHARKYRLVVIGSQDVDVINWCNLSLLLVGLINMATGITKSLHRIQLTFNQFILLVVLTLVCNFCIGMILTEHKHNVAHGLEDTMLEQLKQSVFAKQRFGVGFQLAEAWDFMQIKLLCCGVHSYKDYIELGGVSSVVTDSIPLSCCAMRGTLLDDSDGLDRLEPDNLSQCRLDARQGVVNSIFLNTQGCHSPISRWLIRYLNRTIAMVFATICLQVIGVLYLSWIGYRRSGAYINHTA